MNHPPEHLRSTWKIIPLMLCDGKQPVSFLKITHVLEYLSTYQPTDLQWLLEAFSAKNLVWKHQFIRFRHKARLRKKTAKKRGHEKEKHRSTKNGSEHKCIIYTYYMIIYVRAFLCLLQWLARHWTQPFGTKVYKFFNLTFSAMSSSKKFIG